jgi:hypothetical protein
MSKKNERGNRMRLSTKLLCTGLGISIFVTLCIIVLTLPLGWTGMPELIPSEVARVIIYGGLGVGLLLVIIGITSKAISAFKKRSTEQYTDG